MKDVIFGYNAVSEALRAGHPINRIYFSASSKRPYIAELKELALSKVRFDFVDIAKLNVLAHTGEHQCVVAVISPVEYTELDTFLDANKGISPLTIIVLDQLQHAGDVEIIVRTAACAGTAAVMLRAWREHDQRSGFSRIGRRNFSYPDHQIDLPYPGFGTAKQHDFWIYGLEAEGDNGFAENWARRSVIVIGNEHEGARPVTRKQVDLHVRIPMENNFDSLNAAVAAGIVLFQVANYHRTHGA